MNSPYKPSLSCNRAVDKFTTSTTNGNGDLEYPIGLITADEVAYAGINKAQATDNYLYTGADYLTMTPMWFYDDVNYEFLVTSNGYMSTGFLIDYGVRPAVSLSNSALYKSGDGTSDNPYTVE